MARRSPVSDAELEVLKVLWEGGAATVRDVAAALRRRRRRLAYNTVLTLLSRLRDKG
jgi:predicted transcriptional regulator